jgi:hypothetical protein
MSSRVLLASFSLASVCALASAGTARAEKVTIDEDTFFNIGILAQPQLQFIEDATPNEGWSTDFFVRRARLVLTGQFDPNIGFIFITDQANWGKGGAYTQQFIVQDAIASYKLGPELTIDAGFMLLPFVRNNYLSAGGLNTLDFRTPTIKFPTANAFRDMGVLARGLVANDLVYYRAGVFNGIGSRPGTTGVDPMNPADDVVELNGDDAPRFTGTVRLNLMGKEDAYAFSGIYFSKEPMLSIGVGADFQPQAYGEDGDHLGLNADVFLDYPIDADNEVIASFAFLMYQDQGTITTTAAPHESGTAFYAELGYRWTFVEPVVIYEHFKGDDSPRLGTLRTGLNFWVSQHKYNVKAELAIPMNDDESTASDAKIVTVQTQVVF